MPGSDQAAEPPRHGIHRVRGLPVPVTSAVAAPGAVEHSFPQTHAAVRRARRFVTSLPALRDDEMLAADAEIVTAELAANAVLHARSAFTVSLTVLRSGLRIAVRDSAPLPSSGDSALVVRPGHGLAVVAHIADRVAVQPVPGGKVVWADLSV